MKDENFLYWEAYETVDGRKIDGYFNRLFSDDVAIGKVKKVTIENPFPCLPDFVPRNGYGSPRKKFEPYSTKYEAVLMMELDKSKQFDTKAEAKKYVEDSYLLWIMNGGTLAEYYSTTDEEVPDGIDQFMVQYDVPKKDFATFSRIMSNAYKEFFAIKKVKEEE